MCERERARDIESERECLVVNRTCPVEDLTTTVVDAHYAVFYLRQVGHVMQLHLHHVRLFHGGTSFFFGLAQAFWHPGLFLSILAGIQVSPLDKIHQHPIFIHRVCPPVVHIQAKVTELEKVHFFFCSQHE